MRIRVELYGEGPLGKELCCTGTIFPLELREIYEEYLRKYGEERTTPSVYEYIVERLEDGWKGGVFLRPECLHLFMEKGEWKKVRVFAVYRKGGERVVFEKEYKVGRSFK